MTIFSIQRFLEDYFERRGLSDVDQYAVRVANAYEHLTLGATEVTVATTLGRLRTAFFRRNTDLQRKQFERQLAKVLLRRFKKKRMILQSKASGVASLQLEDGFSRTGAPSEVFLGNSKRVLSLARSIHFGVQGQSADCGQNLKRSHKAYWPFSQRAYWGKTVTC